MIKVLELFCGTKSVGKCCDSLGWETISLDYEKKFNATHTCDILDFDYKQYPQGYFDIIWASPDCRFYSRLQNTWIGRKKKDGIMTTRETIEENRKHSDTLIYKVWEIIDYLNPQFWFLENPLSSLKDREVMKDKPYYIVDYCMYSDWGYKKRTCIWTNKKDWEALVCDNKGSCGNMINIHNHKIHKTNLGNADNHLRCKHKTDVSKDVGGGTNRLERYRVPLDLIYSLFLD